MKIIIRDRLLESLLHLPFERAKEQIAALGEAYGKDYQNHLMWQYVNLFAMQLARINKPTIYYARRYELLTGEAVL